MPDDSDPTLVSDLLKDLGGDPAEHASGHFGGPRIVVVEDEPAVLDLLRDVLNIRRYFVIGLKHPDVYAIAGGLRPDLFLIDLMLPQMNGIELAKQLRAGGFERTPMIAMSASADFLRAASDSGLFQAALQKPFDVGVLLQYVDRYSSTPLEPAGETAEPPLPEGPSAISPDEERVDAASPSQLLTMLQEQQTQLARLERQVVQLQAEVARLQTNDDGESPESEAAGRTVPPPSWWQRIRRS